MLCIHGSKDFWERLSWIADVSELVQSHPALDWDRVLRFAQPLHATRMLNLGLALAAGVLGASLPPKYSARVQADRVARRGGRRSAPEVAELVRFARWMPREDFTFVAACSRENSTAGATRCV